jgi:hypothetical protein
MSEKKVCLRAVMSVREDKRVWAGEYACSICGQRFHPDAKDPAKLTEDFSKHSVQHSAVTDKR